MLYDLSVILNHKNEIISALIGFMCTCFMFYFFRVNPL